MAIFQATGLTRRLSKSAGEQTFCQVRGRNVAKMKITDNKSNTPKQQAQRLKWSTLSEIEYAFDEVVRVGFPSRPVYHTVHNAFMQANKGVIEVGEDGEAVVHYERIVCAKGRQELPKQVQVTVSEADRQLTFTHSVETNGARREKSDMLYAAVLEKELAELELFPLNSRSSEEAKDITLNADWDMQQLAIYVFVLSEDGHKASMSKYLVPEGA